MDLIDSNRIKPQNKLFNVLRCARVRFLCPGLRLRVLNSRIQNIIGCNLLILSDHSSGHLIENNHCVRKDGKCRRF